MRGPDVHLTQKLNYRFRNPDLLTTALTHSTYAYENLDLRLQNNERLEFLGDAVLQLVVSHYLHRLPEQLTEGQMTKARALVVCENTLTQVAREVDLGDCLLLGKGERLSGGANKPSNLSNAIEAVFGAIYLDQGFEMAEQVILHLLEPYITEAVSGRMVYDFKSRLLELVQSTRGNSTISFEIIDEAGPVHARIFTAAVCVDGQQVSTGRGSNKKEAEQEASRLALTRLSCDREGCTLQEEGVSGQDGHGTQVD